MNLPDMSSALLGWTQPLVLKTIDITSVDFVETTFITGKIYDAVVQPTKKTMLNAGLLDWSRAHITLHSEQPADLGQLVEYKGKDYKIIEAGDYSDYGYWELVAEDTKKTTLTVIDLFSMMDGSDLVFMSGDKFELMEQSA